HQTKSPSYSGSLKSPAVRYTEIQQQQHQQQPPVITPFKSITSAYKSASASAAASASSAAAYTSDGSIKGGGYQQRSSRYSIPRTTGQAYTKVNFQQYGPSAFQYSYAY
ncbi:hypothetical protein BLA29_012972, partial [Euroglyphus maynei]